MCEMCVSEVGCWCNYCIAYARAKPCPRCHHLRVFYSVKVRAK